MPSKDPTLRRLASSIAGEERWARLSKEDRADATAAARKAFWDRFDYAVDPDGTMDPVERATRAEHLRKAYFHRLALASAKARRARRSTKGDAA